MASQIDDLVANLESSHGLWVNGLTATVDPPESGQAIDFLHAVFAVHKIENFTIEEGPVARHITFEDYTIFRCTVKGQRTFVILNQTNTWYKIIKQ